MDIRYLKKFPWLKIGNLCYFDEDGFLYIVDPIKDPIKHNGYQVPQQLSIIIVDVDESF